MRTSTIQRKSQETDICVTLTLDGKGTSSVDTGCGFLDHMLTLFASHGRFDLALSCKGDLHVDAHHTAEDIGICLGSALREALGEKRGITRYGSFILPMDEALILCALDISGRAYLAFDAEMPAAKVGEFDTELTEEFFLALTRSAGITLHIRELAGKNTHHIIEGIFKAFARALKIAVAIDETLDGEVPSTKGVLA